MVKWWWGYQSSASQGPLIPEVIHPDPSTTILLYITRRAWRCVVLQTIRLQDGYSWRTANHISQGYGERIFVGDSQSRIVRRLYAYPYPVPVTVLDRISSKIWLLNKVFLGESINVLDGYSWRDYNALSWTMPEAVEVADGYSRMLRNLVTKTMPEAVEVADGYSRTLRNLVTKTLPEAVTVTDGYKLAETPPGAPVDVDTRTQPESVGVTDGYTATEVEVRTVTLEESVKVAEGGVLNPPPDPEYPDATRYVYRLGEKVLVGDGESYEEEEVEVEADFTTWTEADGSNRLSQTATRSSFTNLNRLDDYTFLYKDFGVGYFDDFSHNFEIHLTSISSPTTEQYLRFVWLTYCNDRNDWRGNLYGNKTQVGLMCRWQSGFTVVQLSETYNGSGFTGAGVAMTTGVRYYCTFVKTGTSAALYVYSNAGRTSLVGISSLTLHADHTFRYILCPQSLDYPAGFYAATGYIQNLTL